MIIRMSQVSEGTGASRKVFPSAQLAEVGVDSLGRWSRAVT